MQKDQKVNAVINISHDINNFLERAKTQFNLPEGLDIEILVFTLFKILGSKIKDKNLDKESIEKLLQKSFNQYISAHQLNLYISKFEYPDRIKKN